MLDQLSRNQVIDLFLRTYARKHLDTDVPARDLARLADLAVAALRDAALLPPAGGEVREDLGYATDKGPRLIGWSSSPATIRRTITTWPDGSMLIGPWAEVTAS